VQGRALSMIEIMGSQFARKRRPEGHAFSRAEKIPQTKLPGASAQYLSATPTDKSSDQNSKENDHYAFHWISP
jgi:hypothetical protein